MDLFIIFHFCSFFTVQTHINDRLNFYKSFYGTFHHFSLFHFHSFFTVQTHINDWLNLYKSFYGTFHHFSHLFFTGLTLQYFIHSFPEVESAVRDAMGQVFFFEYMNEPDSFYLNLTPIHIDILVANQVDLKLTASDE